MFLLENCVIKLDLNNNPLKWLLIIHKNYEILMNPLSSCILTSKCNLDITLIQSVSFLLLLVFYKGG